MTRFAASSTQVAARTTQAEVSPRSNKPNALNQFVRMLLASLRSEYGVFFRGFIQVYPLDMLYHHRTHAVSSSISTTNSLGRSSFVRNANHLFRNRRKSSGETSIKRNGLTVLPVFLLARPVTNTI